MAMEYAIVTGKVRVPGTETGIAGQVKAYPLVREGVLSFPAEDILTVGPAIADVADDGALTPALQIPTDVPEGLAWRIRFVPKGTGNLPVHLGDFPITEDADLADLVPISGTVLGGSTDHGDVIGELEVTSGSHELDIAGHVEVTVVGTGDVTLFIHGTGTVFVAGETFDLTGEPDPAVILVVTSPRGDRYAFMAGGVSGSVDETPPSPPTFLEAEGGAGSVTFSFTAGEDPDSTATTRFEIYSGSSAGTSSPVTSNPMTVTGLTAGTKTVRVFTRSAGGDSEDVTATVTVTAPPTWSTVFSDTFTATDGTVLHGHNTDTGSKTWVKGYPWAGYDSGMPDIYIKSNRAIDDRASGVAAWHHLTMDGSTITRGRLRLNYDMNKNGAYFGDLGFRFLNGFSATIHSGDANMEFGDGISGATVSVPLAGLLEFDINGTVLTISIDGTAVKTATLGSAFAPTKLGVTTSASTAGHDSTLHTWPSFDTLTWEVYS